MGLDHRGLFVSGLLWKPSDEEVPAVFPIGETIASNDTVSLVLTLARVHSNGVEFVIDRRIRRGSASRQKWQQMQSEIHNHFGRHDPDRLRYGVALGDGQQLIVDTPRGMFGETPEQHCLTPTGGGGLILVLATMMLPPQVTLIPIFLIWNGLGVTDSYLPLILPTFLGTPFFIFLIRQFLMNVPDELIEASPDRWCLRVPNLRDDRVTHRSSCYRDGCGIPVRLVVDRLSEPTYLLE